MFRNNNRDSTDNVFNISGQNIMTNNRNVIDILKENQKLKADIIKTNREIENAKKRISIIKREIENYKRKKIKNNQVKNRGNSVGIRNNINYNNNYNESEYNGGMFNEKDPFADSFFQFSDEI